MGFLRFVLNGAVFEEYYMQFSAKNKGEIADFDTNAFGHTKRGNEDRVFIAP